MVPDREERLKYGTICFDELDINKDCDIDRYTDEPINPQCKKDAQIMQYRQIAGKEKLPFFVDIDHAVTPDDVMNSISMFKKAGIEILSVTCDQGANNRELARKMGIAVNKLDSRTTHTFKHPEFPDRVIYWIWDFPHLFKNLRSHLLDDVTTLPCGNKVTRKDFWELVDLLRNSVGHEHTSGFHLSDEHLECEGQDRQDIPLALQLISERTGHAFMKYFPKDKAKQALGKLIICAAKSYKIMTSRCMKYKGDDLKSALRIYYQEQCEVLNELKWYMQNTDFKPTVSAPNYFQKGIIRTIDSIFGLHAFMRDKLNLPYLMTSKCDQNYVEMFNKTMRSADGKGGVRNPTGLQLMYRVARSLTVSILEDETFNIFDLKDEVLMDLQRPENKFDTSIIKIPRNISETEMDGMYWGAGFVAFRMKEIQNLGTYVQKSTRDYAKNKFAALLNRGGLQIPLKTWLKDYQAMSAYFQSYHPKNGIRPGRGLLNGFFNQLKKKFPQYQDPVLHLVTRVFTRFRMRAVNKLLQNKKKYKPRKDPQNPQKGRKCSPVTPRGRRKRVDQSVASGY